MLKSLSWLFGRPDPAADTRPWKKRRRIIAVFVLGMHLLGIFTATDAVMSTRTSQGAISWAVSSITFPYVAVPVYWVFGQSSFYYGYSDAESTPLMAATAADTIHNGGANLIWSARSGVGVGVEYAYAIREVRSGANGDNHRVQFAIQFGP